MRLALGRRGRPGSRARRAPQRCARGVPRGPAGGRRVSEGGDGAGAGRVPRPGHVQRGGAAEQRVARRGRAGGRWRASEAVAALREGRVELAIVPIENSLEGSINVTLDLLGRGAAACGSSASAAAGALLPDRATRDARCRTMHGRALPPAGAGAVRALAARRAPGRARSARGRRPPRRCARSPPGRTMRRALGTPLAAEIYGAVDAAPRSSRTTANETRFVWLARRPARRADALSTAAARGRARSSSGAPARRTRAGSSAASRSSPRATSTSRRSSRGPRARRLGRLHVLRSISTGARRDVPGPAAEAMSRARGHSAEEPAGSRLVTRVAADAPKARESRSALG